MGRYHEQRFPGEDDGYRAARDRLLEAEMELRRQVERVAALRRELPRGGRVEQDYVFTATGGKPVRLSELFADGKPSLVVYSFMYAPGGEPCPMCTAFLDGLNGNAPHIRSRINLAVAAKAPAADIGRWAERRGWSHLRLVSSGETSYNADYGAETPDGDQLPLINVFERAADGGVYHRYASELFYAPAEPGQHPRHADQLWSLWNVLDLTPEGRGDWFPQYAYDA